MKHKVYEVNEKAFTKDGETKKMKSLVLQRDGAQYPIKNVAMWDGHPLFEGIAPGQEIDVEIIEKDSQTPNPHSPGTFYKNRSVAMPSQGQAVQSTQSGTLEEQVKDLQQRVFTLESHLKPKENTDYPDEELDHSDVPW